LVLHLGLDSVVGVNVELTIVRYLDDHIVWLVLVVMVFVMMMMIVWDVAGLKEMSELRLKILSFDEILEYQPERRWQRRRSLK
jgi:hypothetical protein